MQTVELKKRHLEESYDSLSDELAKLQAQGESSLDLRSQRDWEGQSPTPEEMADSFSPGFSAHVLLHMWPGLCM